MKTKSLIDLTYEEFFYHQKRYDIPADGKIRIIGRNIENKERDIEIYIALEEISKDDEEKEKIRKFNDIAKQVSRQHAQLIHERNGAFYFIPIRESESFFGTEKNPYETYIHRRTQILEGSVIVLGHNYRLKLETKDIESEQKNIKKVRESDTSIVDFSEIPFQIDSVSH